MQTISHEYKNRSYIFDQLETLYSEISDGVRNPTGLFSSTYCPTLKSLDNILHEHIFDYDRLKFNNRYPRPLELPVYDKDNVIVCASGGKDSTAVAKLLKDKGHNVYLYYMRGINKVYSDELAAIERIADYLKLPLHVDDVVLHGKQDFIEHPLKNYMIMNGAIHFGIESGIGTTIALGNFSNSSLENNPFDVCAGDCIEMWNAYEDIIKPVVPSLCILLPLSNNQDTFDLLKCDTKLLGLTQSCISPQRFREHWRKRTCDTYGIKLWNHRCGCCWKCAMEYIYCADHILQDFHLDYYLHCIVVLYNVLRRESRIVSRSVQDVWEHYLFYDISESRLKGLKDAIIQGGKVKFTK